MKQAIYETSGRAKEFCPLSVNLYSGCGHACTYCYGADVTHQNPEDFKHKPRARVTTTELDTSALAYERRREMRPVLLCFVTDPYQPLDVETQLTRKAISILHGHGLRVTILTKGGKRAERDFDLLRNGDTFATTMTCVTDDESLKWEPFAALPHERLDSLAHAHRLGIKTWVSLEPVIKPEWAREIIELTFPWVGHYKVGTMNYHPHGQTVDWKKFATDIIDVLESLNCRYYIKKDLGRYIGEPDGIYKGVDLWGETK